MGRSKDGKLMKSDRPHTPYNDKKKEEAFQKVGERYGRAITRLSDT